MLYMSVSEFNYMTWKRRLGEHGFISGSAQGCYTTDVRPSERWKEQGHVVTKMQCDVIEMNKAGHMSNARELNK